MNTENSKKNESHRFKLVLADKINLKKLKKNMASVNLSIYYTWKNMIISMHQKYYLVLHQIKNLDNY